MKQKGATVFSKLKKLTIALAVMAKNEEEYIGRCIDSCVGVDYVAVLDTGSSDKTIEVAASRGAVVSNYQWNDDYGAARTASLRLVPAWVDWIISMDADEVMGEGGVEVIASSLSKLGDEYNVVQLLLKSDSHPISHWFERIMRNKPGIGYSYPIDECYVAKTSTEKVARIVEAIITYTDRTSNNPEKNTKNLSIVADFLRLNPGDERMQYVAGRRYFAEGDVPSAIYWLERYLRTRVKKGSGIEAPQVQDALWVAGNCYARMLELDMAKQKLTLAWEINHDFRDPCDLLMQIAVYEGDRTAQDLWMSRSIAASNGGLIFGSDEINRMHSIGARL
jgi:glycosyltransferase involved in cell wall biosynthesis